MKFTMLKNVSEIMNLLMDDLTTAYYAIDKKDFVHVFAEEELGCPLPYLPKTDANISKVIIRVSSLMNAVDHSDQTLPKWYLDIIFQADSDFNIKMVSYIEMNDKPSVIKECWQHMGHKKDILESFREMCPIYPVYKETLRYWYNDTDVSPIYRIYPNLFLSKSELEEVVTEDTQPAISSVDVLDTPRFDPVDDTSEAVKVLGNYIKYIETTKTEFEGLYVIYSVDSKDVYAVIKGDAYNQYRIKIAFYSNSIDMYLYGAIYDRAPGTSEKERTVITATVKPDDPATFKKVLKFMTNILTNNKADIRDITF